MSTLAAPVVGSPLPLASLATTLMTQVAREGTAGFWIASGGPKKQFSTGWQAPAVYRQEAPRSKVFVVQVASESISPENGGDAGLEKPAPPQPVVPAAVVYLSDSDAATPGSSTIKQRSALRTRDPRSVLHMTASL